ncbi:oxidoreductase [Synechococcus sp. LA31]|jgi:protochlorophyllide reductase|uniref:oxidoreductase n=1 Tax=Synechococcus sp. LA31 TaxID=2741953 RepID=UPI001BDD52F6|nr:oxidoreductase [Synechococcus sp. LA31]QVV67236.1 SDR family NAD(P)-dependent oxidoreductase [Synechococcus sp. LA31]
MTWTCDAIPDQRGRTALITGANSGLGLETARALAAKGARVVMACRNQSKAEAACQKLTPGNGGDLIPLELDLADLASVRRGATEVAERWGGLDLLINNAGVMAPPRQLSAQGFELQFAVNHLGHFALTQQLLPLLRQGARVVHVSSGASYFGRIAFDDLQGEQRYDAWAAYAQSKLANVMTALELQRRLNGQGAAVLSIAAHPGLARTNLQPTSVAARGSRVEALAYRLMDPLFQSAAMGALPQLFAATASDAEPGGFYGPGGLGNLKGYPKACRIAPAALDAAACNQLWEVSEELCNA